MRNCKKKEKEKFHLSKFSHSVTKPSSNLKELIRGPSLFLLDLHALQNAGKFVEEFLRRIEKKIILKINSFFPGIFTFVFWLEKFEKISKKFIFLYKNKKKKNFACRTNRKQCGCVVNGAGVAKFTDGVHCQLGTAHIDCLRDKHFFLAISRFFLPCFLIYLILIIFNYLIFFL